VIHGSLSRATTLVGGGGIVVALAVAIAGCQLLPEAEPTIDQARAIDLARAAANQSLSSLRSARLAPIGEIDSGQQLVPASTLVWEVTFTGSGLMPCGPSGGNQRCVTSSHSVVLDAHTGAVIFQSESGQVVP
jgi:hypothetical protein